MAMALQLQLRCLMSLRREVPLLPAADLATLQNAEKQLEEIARLSGSLKELRHSISEKAHKQASVAALLA